MGRIAAVLSFLRGNRNEANVSDVVVDVGGQDNLTCEHYAPIGDDSHPLVGDFAQTIEVAGTGRQSVVGYLDAKNQSKALAGEKRLYSRDENGDEIATAWIKNTGEIEASNALASVVILDDGTVEVTTPSCTFVAHSDGSIAGNNSNGSYELQAAGDFIVNGVIIRANGDVIIPNSLNLAGKEIAGHNHPAGSPPGNTGPNN